MRLIRKFRHETARGAVIEVTWTPEGLEIAIDGEPQDTRAGSGASLFVEYGGPEALAANRK